ncbi:uncharacterized protein LOC133500072 isoform X2 [Syngnathoides biaculeatus]|uniref:uncharacterized protein LOC133500072 isoform X2 n=1 Tax=Syngnathoides biaculeatus TaxID=300417 RepID=UPI002ADE0C63|nr:uncharacterized protein LOC133500072 isoform X2 [Syngnathoides biaculeatus]
MQIWRLHEENQQAQLDHVPRRAVVVAHQVERHGDVRVAVVATQLAAAAAMTTIVMERIGRLFISLQHIKQVPRLLTSEASPSMPGTVRDAEVPHFFRERYVRAGYRPLHQRWGYYFLSAFRRHNETVNIWTHLLALLALLAKMSHVAQTVDLVRDRHAWPLLILILSALNYTAWSVAAHLLGGKSEMCHYAFFFLDYVGVAQYQYGSAVVHYYYAVEEGLHRRAGAVFMPVAALLSWLSCLGCCYDPRLVPGLRRASARVLAAPRRGRRGALRRPLRADAARVRAHRRLHAEQGQASPGPAGQIRVKTRTNELRALIPGVLLQNIRTAAFTFPSACGHVSPLVDKQTAEKGGREGAGRRKMGIKLYYTTVTASRTIKSQQSDVMRILDSKNIQYELVDISVGGELRDEMRSKAGNPAAVPPQLFNEDQYCGDFEMFSEAVEADTVTQFLKLA